MKQRPIGLNGNPIPHGMLYSDYTPEQIEAACNAPDFEEKCKHAQENADKMLALMMKKADREIEEAMKKKGEVNNLHLSIGDLRKITQSELQLLQSPRYIIGVDEDTGAQVTLAVITPYVADTSAANHQYPQESDSNKVQPTGTDL